MSLYLLVASVSVVVEEEDRRGAVEALKARLGEGRAAYIKNWDAERLLIVGGDDGPTLYPLPGKLDLHTKPLNSDMTLEDYLEQD